MTNQFLIKMREDMNTDQVLISRFLGGDKRAFEELWDNHLDHVIGQLRGYHLRPEQVEDVAQNAAMRLVRKVHQFRGQSKFSSWLFQLVRNEMLMYKRQEDKHSLESLDDTDIPSDSDLTEELDARRVLHKTITRVSRLPQIYQQVLPILAYWSDQKLKPAAIKAGIPKGAVKSRIFRLRKILAATKEYWREAA